MGYGPGELVHTSVCMETPPFLYGEPPAGVYVVEKIYPPVNGVRCPVCKQRPEFGISIVAWDCGPDGFNSCCFRPLNEDDYKRIREKHKNSLPKGNVKLPNDIISAIYDPANWTVLK